MSTQAQSQQGGVGALLKQSREQRGLTTAEVASQLRLKVSQIEQIEAEQWDPAVSATFIRGYLRAYARLMKLPEKEILANFELQAAYLRNQAKPMHSFSNKASLDAVDNRFMLASYLLVVLLIGLFLVWFWQTHLLDSKPVTVLPELTPAELASTIAATPAEPDANVAQADLNSTQNTSVPATAAQNTATPADAVSDTETQQVTDAGTDTGTAATAANTSPQIGATPTQNQPELVASSPAQPAQNEVVATETPAANAAQNHSAAGAGSARLNLQFSAECWLEVTDATGKRLAYGTRQAGQNDVLTGTAPFKVLLGNAAAAKVQFNDVAVDLSGYAAGRVARLTLGGQP
ncbi:cytoskeleton protein RodZ [Rheinheimera sp.]|uniref:cytoskeleton protein RodZ n=1 Tax=Rheinheimera sp. TaxID=1869214 RepID=UPI002FDE8D22